MACATTLDAAPTEGTTAHESAEAAGAAGALSTDTHTRPETCRRLSPIFVDRH
jgi:hypothetical protein